MNLGSETKDLFGFERLFCVFIACAGLLARACSMSFVHPSECRTFKRYPHVSLFASSPEPRSSLTRANIRLLQKPGDVAVFSM
jgi:hypothetical protein